MLLSRLRVEPEDAQFLVAATSLGDARRPRDGLIARRQFQHGEAAVERGRPRIAAHHNGAVSIDAYRRKGFVDSTGSAAVNEELAKKRAQAVRDALQAGGVSADRIDLRKPQAITAGQGSDREARRVDIVSAG